MTYDALTKPERALWKMLESNGFHVKPFILNNTIDPANCFYAQVPFDNMVLDFALPTASLAIEVNGDYWHGSRTASVTARQLKRQMNDTKKAETLARNGWKLLTIVASDIERPGFTDILKKRIWDLMDV
jgi:very-short-patch-repair endonuclease